jgi:hypothetical protein
MQQCLISILDEFSLYKDFINNRTQKDEESINRLFVEFLECFSSLGAEKLEYPNEFVTDVKLYKEGFAPILEKFKDIEIQYLMLSDFYDFCRLTKKYRK